MTARAVAVPLLITLAVLLGVGAAATAPAGGAAAPPSLRLIAAVDEISVVRWDASQPVYTDIGTYLAPVGGPLEVRARQVRGKRFEVQQILTDGTARSLPPSTVRSLSKGLRDFFAVTVTTSDGTTVQQLSLPFCPQPGFNDARVDDTGPDAQRYGASCMNTTAITRGAVWGVDAGWAVGVPSSDWWVDGDAPAADALPDGVYDVEIAITPRYVQLFGIEPGDASRSVRVTVTTMDDVEEPFDPEVGAFGNAAAHPHAQAGQPAPAPEVGDDVSGLPELVALPARDLEIRHEEETGRDHLAFAATVWNAGPGPLVVEGFREPGSGVMQAYQYFYEQGQRTGRAEVGTLEYDPRDGHEHWHFTDFARFRLLDADSEEVVAGEKEAFCLADTDPVDLTVPGANLRGGAVDLHTACGYPASLWLRQVLSVGWGDTYGNSLPGQAFDITDLPNGTYAIEVATNADGRLRERDEGNNVALRRVVLGGSPGARTVKSR